MAAGVVEFVAWPVAAAVAGDEAEGEGVVGELVGREVGGVEAQPAAAFQPAGILAVVVILTLTLLSAIPLFLPIC